MDTATSTRLNLQLTRESFEGLLTWLDEDRDRAGEKYEAIRLELIKTFVSRGCPVSEELADETINRVALKAKKLAGTYVGDPALYFYGVAKMVYLEYLRSKPPLPDRLDGGASVSDDRRRQCLEQCISRLTQLNRELILAYYSDDDRPNIDRRKELACQLGLEPNALWVRAHRIRERLRQCVSNCLNREPAARVKDGAVPNKRL